MKNKILKTVALVMSLVLCMGMTVLAAPSKEAGSPVTGGTAEGVSIILEEVSEEDKALIDALKDELAENESILDAKNVIIEGNVEYPVMVTFNVDGVWSGTEGYILAYCDGEWVKLDTTMGNGTMTASLEGEGLVVFVVDETTLAGSTTSPKTSAGAATMVALAGLSAATVACGLKKKRA